MQAPVASLGKQPRPMTHKPDMAIDVRRPDPGPAPGSRTSAGFTPKEVLVLNNVPLRRTPCTNLPARVFPSETLPGCRVPRSGRFGQIYRGSTAIGLLLDLKREFLPLVECAQTRFLDRANVDKDIFAPRLRADEAVSFGRVEPFYGACRHRLLAFPVGVVRSGPPARPPCCTGARRRTATPSLGGMLGIVTASEMCLRGYDILSAGTRQRRPGGDLKES